MRETIHMFDIIIRNATSFLFAVFGFVPRFSLVACVNDVWGLFAEYRIMNTKQHGAQVVVHYNYLMYT